jgi:hypothetical protein
MIINKQQQFCHGVRIDNVVLLLLFGGSETTLKAARRPRRATQCKGWVKLR